jgi:hypothetical protein
MLFTGEIRAGFLGAAPQSGDRVLIFSIADGQFVGDGPVGSLGQFQAVATRSASFSGTLLVLELQQGRKRFALLKSDGTVATAKFAGRLLPERTPMTLNIGRQTAELQADEAANPQAQRLSRTSNLPCDAQADVNEDGRCDDEDWHILRRYAGGVTRTVGRP